MAKIINKIGNIIGIISIINNIVKIFKDLHDKTNTDFVKPEFISYISNRKNNKKLLKEIKFYHINGFWRLNKLPKL